MCPESSEDTRPARSRCVAACTCETVKILVKRGADVRYRDDWGYAPLGWAEYRGYSEIIALLKDKMAQTPFKADARHHE